MKKLLVLLVLVMMFVMVGCGNKNTDYSIQKKLITFVISL